MEKERGSVLGKFEQWFNSEQNPLNDSEMESHELQQFVCTLANGGSYSYNYIMDFVKKCQRAAWNAGIKQESEKWKISIG